MIAAAVASGALSCGQCPVASRVTSRLPGIRGVDEGADLARGDHVLRALAATSVGTATAARSSRLSDRNVVRAKTRAIAGSVRQKLLVSSSPELRPVRVAHDHRRHRRGPAQVVAVQRLQQLVDVLAAEPAAVAVVVDVAGRGRHQHQRGEPLRRPPRGQHPDHRADRVPDEHDVAAGPAPRRSPARPRRSPPASRSARGSTPTGPNGPRRRGRTAPPGTRSASAGTTSRHMFWSQPNPCASIDAPAVGAAR